MHRILPWAITLLTVSLPAPIVLSQNAFTGQPPILINTETPDGLAGWPNAHYYFIFTVPKNSVESVGKVTIQPGQNPQPIQFNLANTRAFQGTKHNAGQTLNVQMTQNPQTRAISVSFDPPVPPGTTFTIRLEARQNPISGTYLFQVTSYPAGADAVGLDMGPGFLTKSVIAKAESFIP
jgi:hypothetical protein